MWNDFELTTCTWCVMYTSAKELSYPCMRHRTYHVTHKSVYTRYQSTMATLFLCYTGVIHNRLTVLLSQWTASELPSIERIVECIKTKHCERFSDCRSCQAGNVEDAWRLVKHIRSVWDPNLLMNSNYSRRHMQLWEYTYMISISSCMYVALLKLSEMNCTFTRIEFCKPLSLTALNQWSDQVVLQIN